MATGRHDIRSVLAVNWDERAENDRDAAKPIAKQRLRRAPCCQRLDNRLDDMNPGHGVRGTRLGAGREDVAASNESTNK